MTDLEYKGKIEIIGKSKDGNPLTGYDIVVKFDGKKIPYLQSADVNVAANMKAFVVLRFVPIELIIKLDDVEVFVRRKETYEPT